jgi:hypothetical protein
MVNMLRIVPVVLLLASCLLAGSCRGGGQAESSGSPDSLYLGFRFGMGLEDFFTHCRKWNQEGVLYEGDALNTVTQEIESFSVHSRIYIKPHFDENDRLYRLDLLFQYNVLPMFRPDLTPVKLREEVLAFMEENLGGKLKPKEHPTLKRVWERVDGHRRVRLYHEGQRIKVEYYDLRHQVTG